MILEQLRVLNYCLYRGEQTFKLRPLRGRPIVLFGGINGGGKTTILEATQLALYGSRAHRAKRGRAPYDQYLRECINRGVDTEEGASVALSFRFASEGVEHLYEVERSWGVRAGRTRESLVVRRDGDEDGWLSENWAQVVESLIPLGISQLFFFDAEQIRFLAEDKSTGEALGSAIKTLLGLDIAERLIADARVLEMKLAKKVGSEADRSEYEALEADVETHEAAVSSLKRDRATLENDRQRAEEELRAAEEAFSKIGGRHWEDRQQLRDQANILEGERAELLLAARTLAAGDLPLALVPELLAQAHRQSENERRAADSATVVHALEERDRSVCMKLQQQGLDQEVVESLAVWMEQDRAARRSEATVTERLGLSHRASGILSRLLDGEVEKRMEEAAERLQKLEGLERKREDIRRSLATVPKEESIRETAAALGEATKRATACEAQASRLDKEIAQARYALDQAQKRLRSHGLAQLEDDIGAEEAVRMGRLVVRTQDVMRAFLERVTAAKIDRLSRFVTESFRFLLRKETLVHHILIDPQTFEITLVDSDGEGIPKDRLSEGEKQIFGIAVLWGLARSASRPLPAIIDTPMGRLDKKHRNHLIDRYFPNASHQVVILSTDTEVDRAYYDRLQPSIARAYHLDYDEATKSTVAQEGYFWMSELAAAVEGK